MKSIRLIYAAAVISLALAAGAAAQSKATYSNPVIAGDYPDPSVVRVGDTYWATVTSGIWAPIFELLRSRDMVNWQMAGGVFQQRPAWAARDFWAPQIREDRGVFYLYYTARKVNGPLCVAVATAGNPSGPYTDHGPLVCEEVGSIDPFATRDENDRPYLIWKEDGNSAGQPTRIWAQQLSEDGLKLRGERTEILRNDAGWERHVVEGSFILRRGGWFYHFYSGNACCGRGCQYALGVARARKLLGPWEKHPRNPILDASAHWQCPGHGDLVTDPAGNDYLLYHAYRQRADAFNIGRETLLDRVTWDEAGWPAINDGKGPSGVAAAPMKLDRPAPIAEFFDSFTAPQLSPGWQWPIFNEQSARIEAASGGLLTLAATGSASVDEFTSAVLAQRTTSGDYVATTLVHTRDLPAGARAGLAAYSHPGGAIGIAAGGGKVSVWWREGPGPQTLATIDAPTSPTIYLRMAVSGGARYRFAVSANGREWNGVGGTLEGAYVEGARVALTVGGAADAAAKFDWLRITPSRPVKASGR